MSRIGKQKIEFPNTVTVEKTGDKITVKGPKGEVSRVFKEGDVEIKIENQNVSVLPIKETVFARSLWGTYASHLKNMIAGVQDPYKKILILEGIGYKADVSGQNLVMALGFSHPVKVSIPDTLKVTSEKNNITILGPNKDEVGEFAAKIRAIKKPEPYKGKGFRYSTEVVKRKQGKKSV